MRISPAQASTYIDSVYTQQKTGLGGPVVVCGYRLGYKVVHLIPSVHIYLQYSTNYG